MKMADKNMLDPREFDLILSESYLGAFTEKKKKNMSSYFEYLRRWMRIYSGGGAMTSKYR